MIKILQVNMFDAGLDAAVQQCLEQCADTNPRESKCISATDAHGLVTAYRKPEFNTLLNSFYWVMPDGMPSVWLGKLKGARQMTRCYGPDFFKRILTDGARQDVTHFFCGGKEGVADALKVAVGKKFGNHNVVGTFCPPFREMSDDELKALAATINQSKANIVWIGLGSPKQELFARRLSKWITVNFIVTVGAAFDFHTDRVAQAPVWMQRIAMEWFFRLMMEPKRLAKRYFQVVPLFIFFNVKEALSLGKAA